MSAAPVVQAAAVPPGSALDASEFLVNSFTAGGIQGFPRVARDAAGDAVVVWTSNNQASSTSGYDIYAQRYDAAGQAQGSAFLVDTFTNNNQDNPAVAMDAAGDFVVAWESYNQAASTSKNDVYARQYNAAGTALQASEFQVNTFTTGRQITPSVAMDAAGDFVVAWESYNQASSTSKNDVYARQYNAAGTASQTSEFLVNTFTSNNQENPVVAMDTAGGFVVAWMSDNQISGTSGYDIYARQYHANGTALQASEFLVNTVTTGFYLFPAVAMDAAGDFVVTWESYAQASSTSGYDIYARQYSGAGTAQQASEFLVNTFTTGRQAHPSVAMDAAGDFVVVWQSYNQASSTSSYDIYARQFTAAGSALQASGFMLNTFTSNNQAAPAVAMDAAGDFLVAWDSNNQVSSTSGFDNYARRFEGPESVNLAATLTSSTSSALAGGSFTVTASVSNNTTITTTYGNVDIDTALGDASGIVVSFPLPAGIVPVAVSGNGWSCSTQSSTSLSCDYGATLAASTAAANLTITFTGNAIGTLPLQAAVISDEQAIVNVNDLNPTLTLIDVKPTANAGSVSTAGAAVSGTLSATAGYHGQVLSFAIASQPVHGSVTLTNAAKGSFSYTPVAGYTGTDSFTFTAGDGTLNSNAAKETITVTASGSGGGSSSGGGGAFGLFSLALLGLPLRRRMRRAASRR